MRKGEKGQALAEMMASMLAIMSVFLGLLFISALGIENIQCMITAREKADINAVNGIASDSGVQISDWSAGSDGIRFTADDSYTTTMAGIEETVAEQIVSTDGTFNLDSNLSTDYVVNNFADALPGTPFFVLAAGLTSGNETQSDPLGARELGDLKNAFRALILDEANFSISQTVYMPIQ